MRLRLAAAMLLCSVRPGIAMAQQSSRQHAHRHRQQVEKSVKLHPKVTAVLVWPPEQLLPPPLIVVTYQEGALSVTAEDATLREVFERLNESTGAAVDAPAMEERVDVHLGPQAPSPLHQYGVRILARTTRSRDGTRSAEVSATGPLLSSPISVDELSA